jgi:hypothetical protein
MLLLLGAHSDHVACFVLLCCRFFTISTVIVHLYYAYLLKIDEEDFGGHAALLQEGLFASFTLFLVKI